ncbi:MAG TPA: aminotransferase class V-fold PLP-dependent enzyme [Trebonia sp.]|jgi:kynureninase|nr:aminotransferase class V-fold PLP-dependent enzyme [Trebonia sp.]
MSSQPASQLDAADPLARFRSRFVAVDDPSVVAYLDGNSLGRPLTVTGERLAAFVAGEWGRGLIRSWDDAWMAEPVTVGDRLAEVALGAAPGQVIVADSTTVLLYKLIVAGVGARPGRDEVVIDVANFPTDRFIVDGIAAERGLSVRYLTPAGDAGVRPADVAAAIGERTALVVLSHVAYRSGFLADMAAITKAAHEAGALILWDLCHSAGVLPIELDACDVDLAAGCTYKYLNGGPGSPAFCYVATRLQEELRQPVWGWMGASDPFAMAAEYRPAKGIRKFISGTPPVLAMQPLKDMLELIAEAGLAAVRRKSVALTEHAIRLADEVLAPLGAVLASPRDAADRGSHVTVDHPRFAEVTAALWKSGVIPDFRPPDGIRIGLSPLSTSFAELERGVEAIAGELRGQ